jgi:phage shock protein PspC (stress-responsive transcriptional regulator)
METIETKATKETTETMKKTFTINISGNVFHIEEDAFEKLQDYLLKLNQYFACQVSGQEILQDIESRIAELLQEKLSNGQEAVTDEWVEEVMGRMGKPEEFGDSMSAETCDTNSREASGEKINKRLYRDGENRVLGGVCSGLSTYFNFDPVFLRVLFVLLVFLGLGISIIVYLVLWIVVPKAKTTAQRLEMRGVEATIPNIQKTIQEEVTEVKNSFSKFGKSDTFQKGKEVANKAGQASVQVVKGLGRAFAVVFGSLFILGGFIGLVTFLVSLAVGNSIVHNSSAGLASEVDFSGVLEYMVSPGLVSLGVLLLILIVGIPLLAILFVGTKLVFRYKTNNKLIGLGAFGIWLAALVAMIAITAGQVSNFSEKSTLSAGKPLNCPTCKTLYIKLDDAPDKMVVEKNVHFEDFMLATIDNEKVLAGNPVLQIEATDADDFLVIIKRTTRGKNKAEVQTNLDHIEYDVTSNDSTLLLNRYFTIGNQSKWRDQQVQVIIKVPKGKMIHLDKDLDQLQFDFDNINNIWKPEMAGKTWIMTPEGLSLIKINTTGYRMRLPVFQTRIMKQSAIELEV